MITILEEVTSETTNYEFNFDDLIRIGIIGGTILAVLLIILVFGGMLINPLKKCVKTLKKAQKKVILVKSLIKGDLKYNNKADKAIKKLAKSLSLAVRLSEAFVYDIGENEDIENAAGYILRSLKTLQLYRKYVFTKGEEDIVKMINFVESSILEAYEQYKKIALISKDYYANIF